MHLLFQCKDVNSITAIGRDGRCGGVTADDASGVPASHAEKRRVRKVFVIQWIKWYRAGGRKGAGSAGEVPKD